MVLEFFSNLVSLCVFVVISLVEGIIVAKVVPVEVRRGVAACVLVGCMVLVLFTFFYLFVGQFQALGWVVGAVVVLPSLRKPKPKVKMDLPQPSEAVSAKIPEPAPNLPPTPGPQKVLPKRINPIDPQLVSDFAVKMEEVFALQKAIHDQVYGPTTVESSPLPPVNAEQLAREAYEAEPSHGDGYTGAIIENVVSITPAPQPLAVPDQVEAPKPVEAPKVKVAPSVVKQKPVKKQVDDKDEKMGIGWVP
jgi:hypothetical protein